MRKGLALAALIGANLFWAGNYVLGAVAVADMDPVSLVYLKWLFAAVPIVILAHFTERPRWRDALRHWPFILLLSALGIGGYSGMLYAALVTTPPITAALINSFNPILILLGAAVFLRDRISLRGGIGIAIAFVGVVLSISRGDLGSLLSQGFRPGDLWMVGVVLVWSAYTILIRVGPQIPPITCSALQVVFFCVAMTPIALVHGVNWPSTGNASWSLLYIAFFPSVASYALWNVGAERIDPAKAGITLNLVTVFTAIIAVIRGEHLTHAEMIGGVLIIGGVILSTELSRRKAEQPVVGEPAVAVSRQAE
ncbi:DMT family transporter [Streptomyces fuscichromogenes]|uniref:Multidrug DMT transporter permease n=1 Tax=Streptomyces fuscichromogenes TaxID=1324013 RepID=A0A918CTE4_9ACTN|nr:DMT family transporter [Streptomyces fuscichromogenes]GGN20441.1 multidrug DMT transporter permease [Streptomyces fuscichromogenes]